MPDDTPGHTTPPSRPEDIYAMSPRVVEWTVRALGEVEKRLGLRPHLHDPANLINRGDIFLFNHFARFETIYPPLFIYRSCGVFSRSIAHQELFATPLKGLLANLGAVPHALPGLLPFLAAEILRGRKVVVFPEGGMIKDRRVINEDGAWAIYSNTDGRYRPHHRGAAILGLLVDAFKMRIRTLAQTGDQARLTRWCETLGLPSTDHLLQTAARPTTLVPGHITFYPIRPPDHRVRQALDLFGVLRRAPLSPKASEEILSEASLLFRDTDMDITLGYPLPAHPGWHRWEQAVINQIFQDISSLKDLFDLTRSPNQWSGRISRSYVSWRAGRLRDQWTGRMYRLLSVHVGHVLASLCKKLLDHGIQRLSRDDFFAVAYLTIKALQQVPGVCLHHTLRDPKLSAPLLDGSGPDVIAFLATASASGVIREEKGHIVISGQLQTPAPKSRIRLDNPLQIYVNEAAPLDALHRCLSEALALILPKRHFSVPRRIALALFDDDLRRFTQARKAMAQPGHALLNGLQTATRSGEPYLSLPMPPPQSVPLPPSPTVRSDSPRAPVAVLLVHGFLASPAEMKPLADQLNHAAIPFLAQRLDGHGTSPWDLHTATAQDWIDSVQRGVRLLSEVAERIVIVGFSTGGTVCLTAAATMPEKLAGRLGGVVAVCAPLHFVDRKMALVPLIRHLNDATAWLPKGEINPLAFRPNVSEHPDINYAHIPVRALNEVRTLSRSLKKHLPQVHCPVLLIQGDHDPVVAPRSAPEILAALGSPRKALHWVPSHRHGLICDAIGDTLPRITRFITEQMS